MMALQSPLAGTWSCNKTCRLLPNVDEELPKGFFQVVFFCSFGPAGRARLGWAKVQAVRQ